MDWCHNVFHELKDDALQSIINPKYPDIQLEMLPSIFPRKKIRKYQKLGIVFCTRWGFYQRGQMDYPV